MQRFVEIYCQSVFSHAAKNSEYASETFAAVSLQSCPLYSASPALPAGLFLQVDGQARRADRLCGGQRNLPQADVAPAGLLLPLQRRPNRHQEEKVCSGEVFRRMPTDPCVFFPVSCVVFRVTHLFLTCSR